MKYVVIKQTIWQRIHLREDTDLKVIISMLENNEEIYDEELGFQECETLFETSEYIEPINNENNPTIEVYEGDNIQECIWDNVNKFNQ